VLLQTFNYCALCFNSIIPGIVGENQKENVMKRTICLVVCALFMVVMMSGVAISAEKKAAESEVIITGTINDANQLVDKEGQVFSIAVTKEGQELVTNVGQKVQVKGTVLENEGQKQISVSAYKVIKE
jgi:hypothetical protein